MTTPRSLTALADAQAMLFARLAPTPPRAVACAEAVGLIAAEDVRVAAPQPPRAIALRAGYAARVEDLAGASSFSPAFLASAPARVEPGEPLPEGCDCVLDAAALDLSGPQAQAFAESYPGENVRRAGEDVAAGAIVITKGGRITATDALVASRAGVAACLVRQPRVRLIGSDDDLGAWVAHALRARGAALAEAEADLVVALGEAPAGALIEAQGLALEPGRDGAVGRLGPAPLIVTPRQPAQVLAAMIALAGPALDRLCARAPNASLSLPLSAKISSRVGVAELALLQARDGAFLPLAVGDAPLVAWRRATHVALIAAGGEGHAAGDICAADPLDA